MNCILWQFEKKKKFRYKMFEREILARGGRVSNWTADRVLEDKRGNVGEMYNCKSQSLLLLKIP